MSYSKTRFRPIRERLRSLHGQLPALLTTPSRSNLRRRKQSAGQEVFRKEVYHEVASGSKLGRSAIVWDNGGIALCARGWRDEREGWRLFEQYGRVFLSPTGVCWEEEYV